MAVSGSGCRRYVGKNTESENRRLFFFFVRLRSLRITHRHISMTRSHCIEYKRNESESRLLVGRNVHRLFSQSVSFPKLIITIHCWLICNPCGTLRLIYSHGCCNAVSFCFAFFLRVVRPTCKMHFRTIIVF